MHQMPAPWDILIGFCSVLFCAGKDYYHHVVVIREFYWGQVLWHIVLPLGMPTSHIGIPVIKPHLCFPSSFLTYTQGGSRWWRCNRWVLGTQIRDLSGIPDFGLTEPWPTEGIWGNETANENLLLTLYLTFCFPSKWKWIHKTYKKGVLWNHLQSALRVL